MPESTRDRPTSAYEWCSCSPSVRRLPNFGPTETGPEPAPRRIRITVGRMCLQVGVCPGARRLFGGYDRVPRLRPALARNRATGRGRCPCSTASLRWSMTANKCDGEGEVKRWEGESISGRATITFTMPTPCGNHRRKARLTVLKCGAPMKPSIKEGGSARKKAHLLRVLLMQSCPTVVTPATSGSFQPRAVPKPISPLSPTHCRAAASWPVLAPTASVQSVARRGAGRLKLPKHPIIYVIGMEAQRWTITRAKSDPGKHYKIGGTRTPPKPSDATHLRPQRRPHTGHVLDPFVGSGTTLAVAQQLGRAGIGLDLNPEYLGIARKRLMKL